MTQSRLFSPLTLRGVRLRNRIVVSPMWQYNGRHGMPTDWHLMHLCRFADGGAGLVFQEGTAVERRGCGTTGDLGIWNDTFIEPLSRLASIIRDNGATPGIQLMHAGRKSRTALPMRGRGLLERTPDILDWDDWEPISASATPLKEGLAPPRAMTAQDIRDVIRSFGEATERAVRAGYEVINLHAGHGYLLHQFLSPATNHRTDAYGGTLDNRTRMLRETAAAVRAALPDDKPLFVRLSCVDLAGWDLPDTITLTRQLLELGVDVIDCSAGGLVGSPLKTGEVPRYGYQVPFSADVRRKTGATTMAVGLIVHAEHAEQIIAEESADLVAVGREVLHNPNWPLDAAIKLGVDDAYALTAPTSGFWLSQRARTVPGLVPSTYTSTQAG
jgi:2,4-dienoyl-CoA reductase-like NADH-dependent reductase (Old Yellow Enzyme family)